MRVHFPESSENADLSDVAPGSMDEPVKNNRLYPLFGPKDDNTVKPPDRMIASMGEEYRKNPLHPHEENAKYQGRTIPAEVRRLHSSYNPHTYTVHIHHADYPKTRI